MTAEIVKKNKENSAAKGTEKITFKCRFCGRFKPLNEMRVLTRFFPLIAACSDCERKMQ